MAEDLILDVDFNITKAEAKQKKLNSEFELSKRKIEDIKKSVQQTTDCIEQSKQKQKQLTAELDNSSAKLDAYYKGQLDLTDKQIQSEVKRNQSIMNNLTKEETHQKQLERTLRKQDFSLEKQIHHTKDIGNEIAVNSKKQNKFGKAFEKSEKTAARFSKRIKNLIMSAMFFSLVTKAFTALRNEFGKLITEQGTKTATLVTQLRSNLAVLGRTIYESVRPAIEWILSALVKITSLLANGIAKILGKNINQMKSLAKETKKTGEEAKKATAGFDTLQTIDTSSGSSASGSSDSGGSATDFSALNGEIDSELTLLMMIASGAALVLGVILAFSGVNIPLGIGLIAVGAIGLAAAVAVGWDSLDPEIQNTITTITAIVSAALLVLGVILAFSGVNIPLGIGLIAVGAIGLAADAALTWNTLPDKTKNIISAIMAIGGTLLIIIGILLCITGVGIPVGIGLMLLGGAALWGSVALNWNAITEKVKKIASSIGNIFKKCWDGIKTGFKAMVNGIIGLANLWIKGLNILLTPIRGIIYGVAKAFGKDVQFSDIRIPTIPKLATGAVIPGGKPFTAILGDQRAGQTNIEAPLDTIVEAVKIAIGEPNFTVEAKGSMSQLIRLLNLEIRKEQNRASVF